MKMSVSHLLFTRFNIQYEPGDTIGIQPDWLEDRLRLFERYCLPSIASQSCQDFVWIILCDSRTPESYQARIEAYSSRMPQIRVYRTPYQSDGYHSLYRQIGREYAEGNDVLISTRLDSDDALLSGYVAAVRQFALEGTEGIVSFPVGRQTFVRDGRSYKIRYGQNHSTSRVETSGFETIMIYDHTQVDVKEMYVCETAEPMWEEIVHGGNMLNDYVPKYHYYITGLSDVWDLSKRWMRFQGKRLMRVLNAFFVCLDKR